MSPMSPESADRRITRLEALDDEKTRKLRVLEPLETKYAVMEERFSNLRGDLNEGFEMVRKDVADLRAHADAQFKAIADKEAGKNKERRAIYTALGLSMAGLIANLALQLLGLGHP